MNLYSTPEGSAEWNELLVCRPFGLIFLRFEPKVWNMGTSVLSSLNILK